MSSIVNDLATVRQTLRLMILRHVDVGIDAADLDRLMEVLWSVECALDATRDAEAAAGDR
jgi:hypothetical protein